MPAVPPRHATSGPAATKAHDVVAFVEAASGQRLRACYQCGKCAAGCPLGRAVDLSSQQIVRALQLGLPDLALDSRGLWMCVGCETCVTRCPCGIDVPRVMDALRSYALATRRDATVRDVAIFHRVFLESVRHLGRLYEAGLIGGFNLLSGRVFDSVDLAWPMLLHGKVRPLPARVRGRAEIAAIFERAEARRASEAAL